VGNYIISIGEGTGGGVEALVLVTLFDNTQVAHFYRKEWVIEKEDDRGYRGIQPSGCHSTKPDA
jgi:hypothetical protein